MRTTTFGLAAAAIALLTSCATRPDGRRMTLAEQWRAMAERQDAAARAFVDTGGVERPGPDRTPPPGPQARSAIAPGGW